MEKEEDKRPKRYIKKVSLFRKRKTPKIRSVVRAHNQKNYTKLIVNIILALTVILILTVLLYIVKNILILDYFAKKQMILTPQGSSGLDNNQLRNLIQNQKKNITNLKFATNSSTVTFYYNKSTYVIMPTNKDVVYQIDLIKSIYDQLVTEGKQAIYIDLRYNKPIVKF